MSVGSEIPAAMARVPSEVDTAGLEKALRAKVGGEVRFDKLTRALYATDASVYEIEPAGVLIPRSAEDVIAAVAICREFHCSITGRGGGTSQAGQAIGEGLQIDFSKYLNRVLELNVPERWVRVEPGTVLDELNAHLRPHGLRFAPDISTASRATIGGMMANNSAGTRSVVYGKTIDHVLEQTVLLADGNIVPFGPRTAEELERLCASDSVEGRLSRVVRDLASRHREEIARRFPKILRRVGGYNLDEFIDPQRPFNLAKLMVGSEGTLGLVLEAKLNLVPLPRAKVLLVAHFHSLLEALGATPGILRHKPMTVEVMDGYILSNTRSNAAMAALYRKYVEGDPEAILCIEFAGDAEAELIERMNGLARELESNGIGYAWRKERDPAAQQQIWGLRESALGLSMAVPGDAKAISFVEDTAVDPEQLRDFIEEFLALVKRHGTRAGIYAHASVGCLHVRPVVNLKTEEGVQQFEAIAREVADLVLRYGGALSGEHGDGLVRSPFLEKMFGPVLYQVFREVKLAFDPENLFNPGKIIDPPPMTENLRMGASYETPRPETQFSFQYWGGFGDAVEMCSGVGACRKTLTGTMCPSYMATRDETHTVRGRANILRWAMLGRLGDQGLAAPDVKQALDLCLECRACKRECPTGVDMARFKSEFLAAWWREHKPTLGTKMLAGVRESAPWGSRLAPVSNWVSGSAAARWILEKTADLDRRRRPPRWSRATFASWVKGRELPIGRRVVFFNDTFTNYYHPEVGQAAWRLLARNGYAPEVATPGCCARPPISQGFLDQARRTLERTVEGLYGFANDGVPILVAEPSCLSSLKEDAPDLLRGAARQKALAVAKQCVLVEEYLDAEVLAGRFQPELRPGPSKILLHGHCHQKSMSLVAPAKRLLERIPGAQVVELDSGCCGMAGSFGYRRQNYELSRAIAERRLLPAAREMGPGTVLVAAGVSCRHQVEDLAGVEAVPPVVLLDRLSR